MLVSVNKPKERKSAVPMRNAVRFPLHFLARVETEEGTVETVTVDISACGVLFNMPFAPNVNSQLRWTIQIPGPDLGSPEGVSVQCVGRVVWHGLAQRGRQVAAVIDGYHMGDSVERSFNCGTH